MSIKELAVPSAEAQEASLERRKPVESLIRRAHALGQKLILVLPYTWLVLFFLIPFVIILKISFAETIIARPPFSPLVWIEDGALHLRLVFDNFLMLLEDGIYWKAYLNSLQIAAISTLGCLLIGYPMAYGIARASQRRRPLLLLLIILPFWTAFILRVYAWIGILSNNGIINVLLQHLGITHGPIQLIYSDLAIYIGIIYCYLPFMILPIYTTLEKMDPSLIEASADLGSNPVMSFFTVTLPLSIPGIIAGSMLVFIPAMGEYVIPALLGSSDNPMMGRVLFDEFFLNRDWPVASAIAVALLALLVGPIVLFNRFQSKSMEEN